MEANKLNHEIEPICEQSPRLEKCPEKYMCEIE